MAAGQADPDATHPNQTDEDELVMNLVELALSRPENEREACIENACRGNTSLIETVRRYVQWEERMQGFLLDPLFPSAKPEEPFEPGEQIEGRFRIVREVARGGMGIVYEAVDERLERRIAIKCARPGFRTRLSPEVRNATTISHPNVCRIFEIHTASTRRGEIDFITMEFLDGETLADRLRRGAFTEQDARGIALQLCAGLAEAHRNHVIHGDLKSNNVILTGLASGSARAVITDFGLAARQQASIGSFPSGPMGGTPDYMAPELWKGEKASIASDIYALGVLLFELAGGRRPFGPGITWEQRLTGKPKRVDAKWDRVLMRCLDADPTRRFQAAGEVALALEPSRSWLWWASAAAATVLAVTTGLVTYSRAAAPKESWRLVMLPIESVAETRDAGEKLTHAAADQLAHVQGGQVARVAVLPLDTVQRRHIYSVESARTLLGATHVLHATLAKKDAQLILRAVLTDARNGVSGREWTAEYSPSEISYAPVALIGIVTSQLGLPRLGVAASVNSDAGRDYWNGLWYLRRNSTIDAALPLLEHAIAEDPDSPLTYAALAEARQWKWFVTRQSSWLERADEAERQAQRRNPDLPQVHRVACLLSYRQGLHELAESECRRANALDPNDPEAHRVLGQAYEATNRLDEALAEYRKAVELDPADLRNRQQLANFYFERSDYSAALMHFQKEVELDPNEATAHYALGTVYFTSGRLAEAETQLRLAIHLAETPDEWHNLGLVLMEERKYTEAIASILRATSLAPEQLIFRMNLGTAYQLMNRKFAAEEAYRRALKLAEIEIARDPRDAKTRSHLAFICARLGEATRAVSEIAQAQLQSPSDGRVRFMAVATFEALGRREDAIRLLGTFSKTELADVNRWPDFAELSHDSRFLQFFASSQTK
jgi:serine/threonine-protein kinase